MFLGKPRAAAKINTALLKNVNKEQDKKMIVDGQILFEKKSGLWGPSWIFCEEMVKSREKIVLKRVRKLKECRKGLVLKVLYFTIKCKI